MENNTPEVIPTPALPVRRRWKWIAIIIALAVICGGVAAYFIAQRGLMPFGVPFGKKEVRAFRVAEKISRSAEIVISLPEDITTLQAQTAITFEPAIKGSWRAETEEDRVVYRPQEKLPSGTRYAVRLALADGEYRGEFLADEDPAVIAAFPKDGSEANENSAISIVFNRPMVGLTTRDLLDAKDVPVVIEPSTEGKLKWISTRMLQFIPKERLVRSSKYTVRLNDGLRSVDGLAAPSYAFSFSTRPLRYADVPYNHELVYNRPIRILFNQPIDLDKTTQKLTLRETSDNHTVEFTAEYGERSMFDPEKEKRVTLTDRSMLDVYLKADRHGRAKLWDFATSYHLEVAGAYPLEGDIALTESNNARVTVTKVIHEITATSPRTKFAEKDLFDPQGELRVSFYEDVNKDRTEISGKGLKEVRYGEKCKEAPEDEEVTYDDPSLCEKVEDRSLLVLSFNERDLSLGERFPLVFSHIVNAAGLDLIVEPYTDYVTVYPAVKLIRSVPENGASGASVSDLILCTNTPLTPLKDQDFSDAVVAQGGEMQYRNWTSPYRAIVQEGEPCSPGTFHNAIIWGLVPLTSYAAALKLPDDFGQTLDVRLAFTAGKPHESTLNFYHYQDRFTVTTPEQTKLTYAVENMDTIDLHICEITSAQALEYLRHPPEYTIGAGALTCGASQTRSLQLAKKYWVKNFFSVQLADYVGARTGYWVLTFSNPDYRLPWGNKGMLYERTLVNVTRLAVTEKRIERRNEPGSYGAKDNLDAKTAAELQNLYWVVSLGSLDPVVNADVTVYAEISRDLPLARKLEGKTDAQGIARTPTVINAYGAVVAVGDDSAIIGGYQSRFSWATLAQSAERIYMYTDRPIYKPGDEVNVKGLFRIGYDGAYEMFGEKPMTVEAFNAKNESFFKQDLAVNDFGTFNGRLTIPADAPLGPYRIQARNSIASFDVQEYVAAPFKVNAKPSKEEYVAGDTAEVNVDASYYFGVPLDAGEVTYAFVSQDYYFDRAKDSDVSFGGAWYGCWEGCEFGDKFIVRGKVPLSSDGHAVLSVPLDFLRFFKGDEGAKSKIFTAYVTVKNASGQSVGTQQSFIVHRGDFYIGSAVSPSFLAKNEAFTVRARTVDLGGNARAKNDLSIEIAAITWKSFRRKEVDGGFYWRWEQVRTPVITESFSTDGKGAWSKQFTLAEEGEYDVRISGKDGRANPVESTASLYVYGRGAASIRPSNDTTLELQSEKTDVRVGDAARVIIQSPFARAKALVSVERGDVYRYEVINVDQNLLQYSIDVKGNYRPNVSLSVTLISPQGDVKYGDKQFTVSAAEEEITVTVTPNKLTYLPGEQVTLGIAAADSKGMPVEAELSVAVVDMSVLALKGNPKKNPLVFFYGGLPLTVATANNLRTKLNEIDVAAAPGEKGGGGASPEDLARKKRGVFKDTAFWEASVRTGMDGKVELRVTLPDNLTTWQAEAVGITRDTKVGVGYKEFSSAKELMAVPLVPRFILPGDTFTVGANIFNQTPSHQLLTVTYASDSLGLTEGKSGQTLGVDKGESGRVYFSVAAPTAQTDGTHRFTLAAEHAEYKDEVEGAIPVVRDNTFETVATAGFTQSDAIKEYLYLPQGVVADRGGLSMRASATLAVFLPKAFDRLLEGWYDNTEDLASRLSGLAARKRAVTLGVMGSDSADTSIEMDGRSYTPDELAKVLLQRIYETDAGGAGMTPKMYYGTSQFYSGGFGYYKGLEPNFFITLHVLDALKDADEAGYGVRKDIVDNAIRFAVNEVFTEPHLSQDRNYAVLAAATLARFDGFEAEKARLRERVLPIFSDVKFLNEDASNMSLLRLATLAARDAKYPSSAKEKVFTVLENRISIDGRGSYLVPNAAHTLWWYFETPVKDTALFVQALAASKRDNAVTPNMLRWLTASRDKDGAWGTGNATLEVVRSFMDYIAWKKENEAHFTVTAVMDGVERGSFTFAPATVMEAFSHEIPMTTIGMGKPHIVGFTRTLISEPRTALYYDAALTYALPSALLEARDEGFTVTRELFARDDDAFETPITEAKAGDVLKGRLVITVPKSRTDVTIEDPIPAGTELVNMALATEDKTLTKETPNPYKYYEGPMGRGTDKKNFLASILGIGGGDAKYAEDLEAREPLMFLPVDREELRNDRLFLFTRSLEPGTYVYQYHVRALVPGTYAHPPAVAKEAYFPENFGRTAGEEFTIHR